MGKMEACGRGGDGSRVPGENSLIPFPVHLLRVGRIVGRPVNVMRQRHLPPGLGQVPPPGVDRVQAVPATVGLHERDALAFDQPAELGDQPAAPCQAATTAGEQIDANKIIEAYQALRHGKDLVLIEGAGGLMVPIRGGYVMADLARQLEVPLLVVTHPWLGTLNHTALTTFAARAMDLELCGFIINQMPENPAEVEKEAPHLLSSLASADLLGVLPEVIGSEQEKVKILAGEIEKLPAYQWLLSGLGMLP